MTETRPPSIRLFLLLGGLLPLLITVIAVVVQLFVLSRLPDPAASQWSATGEPTNFGLPWVAPLVTGLVGLGLPVVLLVTSVAALRRPEGVLVSRLMGALSLGTAVLIAILATWSTLVQVDVADAVDARLPIAAAPVAFAAAIAAGLLAWLVLPREDTVAPGTPAVPRRLRAGERAVWTGTATLHPGATALIVLSFLGVAVASIGTSGAAAWIMAATALVVLVAVATTLMFRVKVDGSGLAVTSVVGLPRFRVPLADIASVEVVSVRPMAQFGGWGVRRVPGAMGVVLRGGEAIQVTRTSGPRFVVTVKDAQTAASLLQGEVDRAATRRRK
ncbi:DUF1648 domain-containing protein [Actinocorallia sp. API 0066]|uniref:DUF1648 domain-containing protein n=1 Tax=Actinocorallia sp. API 0066 TaxID=2896846 RepID=UPI001E541029|nr:DUF1648 domain-containing protein [Actinocorallia sp. API 0066]MCD0448995.1 DUF1648 domain-containing protein [Actinocorallia sp. API 0066]